jgi:hypothetical protein
MPRIKTIFGVTIPPRKKKRGREPGCKVVTMDFVITGAIPSKKNRILPAFDFLKVLKIITDLGSHKITVAQAIDRLKTCKPYLRHSKKFREWEEQAKQLLITQAGIWAGRLRAKGYDVQFPISDASISIYHYWKDNAERDNSNKAETIHDLLISAGIITKDSWQCLTPTLADAECYQGEILDHITEINLTAFNWI